MEDGCSKRFDIETVDFKPQGYSNSDQSSTDTSARAAQEQARHTSYGSPAHFPSSLGISASQLPHDASLTSASALFLERQEYISENSNPDSVWAN